MKKLELSKLLDSYTHEELAEYLRQEIEIRGLSEEISIIDNELKINIGKSRQIYSMNLEDITNKSFSKLQLESFLNLILNKNEQIKTSYPWIKGS